MKTWPVLVGAILLGGAAPPPASATKEDLKCFIALAMLANSEDPDTKQAGSMGTIYFLGRLDGRSPGLDIETAVGAEVATMTEADQASLLKSCGDTLTRRGDYLVATGKALQKGLK